MGDSVVTPDLSILQGMAMAGQNNSGLLPPSATERPVSGPAPANNASNAGPVKAGLGSALRDMLQRFSYGTGQAMMKHAGLPTDADLAVERAANQLRMAQAKEAEARAQDYSTQAQARQLALQPVPVPSHIATEFGLEPGTQVPAGQLHEYAHTYASMRASGKMEDPEAAFERRQKWGQQMGLNPDELKTYSLTGQLPKPEKGDTATDLQNRHIQWRARKKLGLPTSPAEDAWGESYEADKTLNTTTKINLGAGDKNTARADRSYQFNTAQLDKLASPLEERTARLLRLEDTINQSTPQADALVAPELLTVMAGGQGSGLRMNEAEIARIVGGRSGWQDLKSAIDKWQADPSKPFSITPVQRAQIRSLISVVRDRVNKKAAVIDDARQSLINTDDVAQHRQIIANAHSALTAVDQGTPEFGGNIPPKVRELMNRSNAVPSAAQLPQGGGKVIDKATVQQFYQAAGGDPNKARQMAQQYGWQVQ